MDGHVYRAGDSDVPFTIQSVSKPFVYALALGDVGDDEILARVGAEPSGEAFNAISLRAGLRAPRQPAHQRGRAADDLARGGGGRGERFERILGCLSAFAGRPLGVDEEVFRSELATASRNRALAYLMASAGLAARRRRGDRRDVLPAVRGVGHGAPTSRSWQRRSRAAG